MRAWTLALPFSVALAACDGSHTEHDDDHSHGDAHSAPADAPHAAPHAAEALELSLNDGARWKMDEHTRGVFAETRTTLAGTAPASLDEAHALGETLDTQLNRLISGCTMDGAAHDELHVFLTAWMPAVAALKASPDLPAASATVTQLQGMVAAYDKAFE